MAVNSRNVPCRAISETPDWPGSRRIRRQRGAAWDARELSLAQQQLVPLLLSYKGVKTLTIEVTSDGIKIGNSTIGRGLWEISLFQNPAAAPQQLKMKPPKTAREVESEKQNMLDL